MRRLVVAVVGFAVIVSGDDLTVSNCTTDDVYHIENMDLPTMSTCITTTHPDDWGLCLPNVDVGQNCSDEIGARITDHISECATPCTVSDSLDCRVCLGVMITKQFMVSFPNVTYGMCGSVNDRDSIMAANWSAVLQAGDMTDLPQVAGLSDSCDYCFGWYTSELLNEAYCEFPCLTLDSQACYDCKNIGIVHALAYCNWAVSDVACSGDDFNALTFMDVGTVQDCMENQSGDGLVHCLGDGGSLNISLDCSVGLDGTINEDVDEWCEDHCADMESFDCYNCRGAIAAQVVFSYAPPGDGNCGSDADKSAISDANMTDVFACGTDAPNTGASCLADVANVSTECNWCLTSRTATSLDQCAVHCVDESSVDCLQCVSIGMMNAAAYCNTFGVLPEVICTVTDYKELSNMNAGAVTTCLEENEDDFQLCLGDVDTVNMTDGCTVPLQTHIEDAWGTTCSEESVCANDILTAYCMNCRGAVMVQEVFAHAPNASGVCGSSDNLALMADVDMTAVIACGSEQAFTGATCLAFQAGASPRCRDCLEEGTLRAIGQCKAHCLVDETGPDCISCVNVGLMSAAAHCNMSGSVGMVGLSLISFAAILSLVFLA